MKKFFYACLGILCLTLAFHFGATSAQGQVSGYVRWLGEMLFATPTSIYRFNGNSWETLAERGIPDPPVPVNQVLFFDGLHTVTTDGEAFTWSGTWRSVGFVPGGATSVHQQTFGQVKTQYR